MDRVSSPPVASASTPTALRRAYPFNDILRRTLTRDGAVATTDVVSISLPRNDRFPRALVVGGDRLVAQRPRTHPGKNSP